MMMVMMGMDTITRMKTEMIMNNMGMMMKINAPFTFEVSEPLPKETGQV